MASNKSTAAQRRFIAALAAGAGDQFEEFFNRAARINQNAPFGIGETPTQAAGRLTRSAASSLIQSMKDAGVETGRVADPHAKKVKPPFLEVKEPELLAPATMMVDDDLTH